MDAAAERHPDVAYEPLLIDATYAGLITGRADAPLVIPALNRDGDLLERPGPAPVRLDRRRRVDPARPRRGPQPDGGDGRGPARHRPRPGGQGRRQPDGDDPRRAAPSSASPARRGDEARRGASAAIYDAVMETTAAGIRTPDLKGHASTTEFTDAVIERVRERLGSARRAGPRPAARAARRRRADPLGDHAVLDHEGGLGLVADAGAALPLPRPLGQLEGGDREPAVAPPPDQLGAARQRLVEGDHVLAAVQLQRRRPVLGDAGQLEVLGGGLDVALAQRRRPSRRSPAPPRGRRRRGSPTSSESSPPPQPSGAERQRRAVIAASGRIRQAHALRQRVDALDPGPQPGWPSPELAGASSRTWWKGSSSSGQHRDQSRT